MGEGQKIKIKRIYLGKVTIVGLSLGLFLGIICTILFLIAMSVIGQQTIADVNLGSIFGNSFKIIISLLIIVGFSISMAILGFLWAVFYNLLAKIGFNLDLEMIDISEENSEIRNQQI